MIGPREPGDNSSVADTLDVLAVTLDDQLLDQIAAGAYVPNGDSVTLLLRALVADVETDLAVAASVPLPAKEEEQPGTRWMLGRHTLRGTVAAVVVGVGLSVSGVSAAVTGDPFAAYESVAGVFDSRAELPPNAAEIAKFNKRMVAARSAVRAGDKTQALARIDALRDMLDGLDVKPQQRAALERRLAKLEALLVGGPAKGSPDETGRPDKPADGTGRGRADAPGGQDKTPSAGDKGTSDEGTSDEGAGGTDSPGDEAGDRNGDKPSTGDERLAQDDRPAQDDDKPAKVDPNQPADPADPVDEPETPDQDGNQQPSDKGTGKADSRR